MCVSDSSYLGASWARFEIIFYIIYVTNEPSSNANLRFFFFFLISANLTCFLFQKYKKIVFSLYSQKQVFENRKLFSKTKNNGKTQLPNIPLFVPHIWMF